MFPAIVIGLGGTGKWLITDLKKNILEANNGIMPENISLLAFDLVGQETPRIERFLFERGRKQVFSLNYEGGPEFCNFSGMWAMPIFDIADGKGMEWPYIYKWLKEDDAKSYNLSREEINNITGAGQRRQTSRDSLFLNMENIYNKVRDAIFRIGGLLPIGNEGKPTQEIQVFIVNSIAGGTGCGTFLDFIYLIHNAIIDRGEEQTPARITAFLVIPRGFEAVAITERSEVSMDSMEKNCFAAFRELHRHLFNPDIKIDYSDSLKNVNAGKVRLFSLCYFIDGTKIGGEAGSKIKHYMGIIPAIADYVFLHLKEDSSPQTYLTNVVRHLGEFIAQSANNPIQAPIYSTFGIYRYIFDVQEVIQTFAHKLASDVLSFFLLPSSKGSTEIKSEAQDFLGSPANTPFNRNLVKYLVEHPGDIRPTKDILFRYIELGSKGEDISLPKLRLEDIPVKIIFRRPIEEIEKMIQERIHKNLGEESDKCTPKSTQRSYYGVLNYYFELHLRKFSEILKKNIINILEEGDRKGSIDHAKKFLDDLVSFLNIFLDSIKTQYDGLNIPDKIRFSTQKASEFKVRNSQKKYRNEMKILAEYRQNELVMKYVVKIAGEQLELCRNLYNQIENWIETFKEGKKYIENAYREHLEVRIDKKAIKIREYVTEPDDEYENKLYQLIFQKQEPLDLFQKMLYKKLPHPNFDEIIRTFKWEFDIPEEPLNALSCLLPAQFSPWKELKEKPIEWNYVFVDNFLRLGKFQDLKNISIMDILVFKNIEVDSFASEIERKSTPLADFSSIEQQRGELGAGATRVTSDNIQVFAEWNVSPPGKDFADRLAKKFQNKPSFHDLHQIIRWEMKHFIKMRGFPNLMATEIPYRNHYNQLIKRRLRVTPLHIFLAEKNASGYEIKLESVLGEKVRSLNPRIVNLLEEERFLKTFTLAWFFDILPKQYRNRKNIYVYPIEIKGKVEEAQFEEDLVSTLEKLLFSEDPLIQEVKKDIEKKTDEIDKSKAKNPVAYSKELKEKFKSMEISPEESPENDLMRVMKIILWEHAQVFEK
ncbi:MAG: tubulin-like doman-containing protein [Acidobacteriota bacterium]